jgi:hypothetical protein
MGVSAKKKNKIKEPRRREGAKEAAKGETGNPNDETRIPESNPNDE